MDEPRWAFVGKILAYLVAITTIIIGGFQLIDRLKSPTVYGIYEYRYYNINPKHRDMIKNRIESKIILDLITNRRQKGESSSNIVGAIEDILSEEMSDLLLDLDLKMRHSPMIIFHIRNGGSSLAREVKLFLPGSGQADISESTEYGVVSSSSAKEIEWSGQILLGDIPPKGNLEVRIWPKDIFILEFNPAIVHAGGTGKIMQLQNFYGWDADLAAWFIAKGRPFQVGVTVSLVAVFGAFFWFASRRGYINIKLRNKDKDTT